MNIFLYSAGIYWKEKVTGFSCGFTCTIIITTSKNCEEDIKSSAQDTILPKAGSGYTNVCWYSGMSENPPNVHLHRKANKQA